MILLLLFSYFAYYIFTFSGSRQFDTFSVDMFDTFSGSRQFDTFSVDTFDTFSGSRQFDTFSVDTFDTFSGSRQFGTFSVDLTHLAELTHLAALTHLAELTHLAVLQPRHPLYTCRADAINVLLVDRTRQSVAETTPSLLHGTLSQLGKLK